MKNRLYAFLIIVFTACHAKSGNKTIENVSAESVTSQTKTPPKKNVEIKNDTLKINNQKFIQTLNDGEFNCLLSMQGDTIVKSEDYYSTAEFLDIDEDGYKDFRVYIRTNTPNQCDNYLFNKQLKTFQPIWNCDLDIQKLKGTPFYYSYNSSGCADLNWESHLSKIEAYDLVEYGYMNAKGCDFEVEKNPQVIEIYKINHSGKSAKKLIARLAYLKYIPKNSDKTAFYENYWKKHFKTFNSISK